MLLTFLIEPPAIDFECWVILDFVVRYGAAIFKLFAGENQFLLIWGNAFLVLNFSLHIQDRVRFQNLEHNK